METAKTPKGIKEAYGFYSEDSGTEKPTLLRITDEIDACNVKISDLISKIEAVTFRMRGSQEEPTRPMTDHEVSMFHTGRLDTIFNMKLKQISDLERILKKFTELI